MYPMTRNPLGAQAHRFMRIFRLRDDDGNENGNARFRQTGKSSEPRRQPVDEDPVLTILFVMIAEVLIFVPSVANYRMTWLAGSHEHRRRGSVLIASDADLELPLKPGRRADGDRREGDRTAASASGRASSAS
jgi:hypothetical protein